MMNASEIEKIVNLINTTSDQETKAILRRLLATWVEREGQVRYPTTVPATGTGKCPQCGVTGVMGYVCPDHNCPSRITC
jgi:hypothetical protein